jgi:hypothetical protein
MRHSFAHRPHFAILALAAAGVACGSSSSDPVVSGVTCGPGTHQNELVCVADPGAGGADGGGVGPTEGGPPNADAGPAAPVFAGVTSVAPVGLTALQVTWSPASDGATPASRIAYHVYVATSAGAQNFAAPTATTPPGATSLLLDTLTANQAYFVVVRAVNEANLEDTNVVEQSATTQVDAVAPTFAGASAAESAPNSALKVSWAAATDDLTGAPGITYLVYLSTIAGGEDFSAPSTVSEVGASSIVIPALAHPDTTYYAVVRARDAAGNLDTNTTEVSAKSGTDTIAPTFAGCTSATVVDASSVTVSWNAATDDTTAPADILYDVFASKTPGGQDFTTPTQTFTGGTLGVVDGLSQATQYYFVCRARDASGNSDPNQSERTATTLSDATPPTFAGLTSVTNVTATTVDLHWAAGADDRTQVADLVYDVYQATSSNAEAFTVASATSAAGATSITLTALDPATQYYWVVRARDKAGNHDANGIEMDAVTSVSFSQNVMPVFLQHCAVSGCHVPGNPPLGLVLAPASVAYGNIYNVASGESPATKRVAPLLPASSYLYKKITGTASVGETMPPAIQNDPLTAAEKTIVENWILQGANQN